MSSFLPRRAPATVRSRRRRNRRRTPLRDLARKSLALGLALTASVLLLSPPQQARAAEVEVVVAARDITAVTTLVAEDLTVVSIRSDLVPATALRAVPEAVGRSTVAAVRAGEILTDARLVGPAAFQAPPGYIPTVVPITDGRSLLPIKVGDCVDIFAGYLGAPLTKVASASTLVSVIESAPDDGGVAHPADPSARVHAVVNIAQEQVTDLVSSLSADVILATLCHAWSTSVDQEPV